MFVEGEETEFTSNHVIIAGGFFIFVFVFPSGEEDLHICICIWWGISSCIFWWDNFFIFVFVFPSGEEDLHIHILISICICIIFTFLFVSSSTAGCSQEKSSRDVRSESFKRQEMFEFFTELSERVELQFSTSDKVEAIENIEFGRVGKVFLR